jgi:hypothetical protein
MAGEWRKQGVSGQPLCRSFIRAALQPFAFKGHPDSPVDARSIFSGEIEFIEKVVRPMELTSDLFGDVAIGESDDD